MQPDFKELLNILVPIVYERTLEELAEQWWLLYRPMEEDRDFPKGEIE